MNNQLPFTISRVVGVCHQGKQGPKVVKERLRVINKGQCYLTRETRVKEKRFLLSSIISLQPQVLIMPIPNGYLNCSEFICVYTQCLLHCVITRGKKCRCCWRRGYGLGTPYRLRNSVWLLQHVNCQAQAQVRLSLRLYQALSGSLTHRLLLCDFDSVTWAWS